MIGRVMCVHMSLLKIHTYDEITHILEQEDETSSKQLQHLEDLLNLRKALPSLPVAVIEPC